MLPVPPNSVPAVTAAVEALPFGVATTDAHGSITWANAAYSQLTGCTTDELLGQSAGEFPWDELANAPPSSEPWRNQAVCKRKTGETYSAEYSITTLRDAAEEVMGFWIMKRDATGPSRSAGVPHEAKDNLSALIESTSDLIVSVDLEYRLVTFNKALRDNIKSNVGLQAAVGMRLEEWLPPQRYALWPPMFDRALSEGPFRTEYSLLDDRTLELSFNPIRQDDRTVGVSVFGKDITERKAAEKGLREAESKYRNIFDGAVEGLYQTSLEGKPITGNLALAKMLGYESPEEGVRAVTDVALQVWLDPNEPSHFVKLLEDQSVVRGYESQFKRKDGTPLWASLNSRIVRDVEGKAPYIEGFVEDITERKRIQDALRKSGEKFAKMFLSSPAITALLRPDHDGDRYLDINEAFERASGYRRDEVIGRTSVDIGLWPDPSDFDKVITQFRADGKLRNVEAHIRTKSGGNRIVSLSADPIEIDGQQCAVVTSINLTEQREAEAQLKAQSKRFQNIIENTDAGYFRLGTDGCFEDVNPAWLRMHGFTRKEDIMSLHFSAVHIPDDVAEAQETVETMMRGEARRGELSTLRQDGTIGYQTFSANPVLDGDRVVGIEGFLVDITAWKTAEEEKRRTLQRANEVVAKAEAHYRLMFNSVSDAVFVHKFGEDGRPSCFLEVNDNACRLLGYTREKLLQMRVADIIAPEEHFNVSANAKRFLADGHATWEGRFAAQDCRRIPVEVNARVFNLDGSPTIMSSVRDISERKDAEARLQAQNERFRRIIENTDAGYFRMGLDGRWEDVNPAWLRMHGFANREEAIGLHFSAVLNPEDQAKAKEIGQTLMRGESVRGAELPRLRDHWLSDVLSQSRTRRRYGRRHRRLRR